VSVPVQELRRIVQESIRVQRGGEEPIEYVDAANAVRDVCTRQNHVIFGRRGCGKTLLLREATKRVGGDLRVVYVNCEDYKQHSFPNVLIEILDQLFGELESHLPGWFGRKARSRELIREIRSELVRLRDNADERLSRVRESLSAEGKNEARAGLSAAGFTAGAGTAKSQKAAIEEEYERHDSKIHQLNLLLPRLKERIREFFAISTEVKSVFLELDDFYHLPRIMQPHVADYVHRLCKDVPLYFKVATLRHASVLFADRDKQPTGIQEHHDYQPIDVDFTLAHFKKTSSQLRDILHAYARRAGMSEDDADRLFIGEGFDRLVLAAGGVPRDFLSLLLEALAPKLPGEERIGKDDVRLLSLGVFQRRVEELKTDSEQQDQDALLRGINAITTFCLDRQTNVFLVPDRGMQDQDGRRELLNRLLDYRIIHSVATALTHKTQSGTFSAFMVDIGAYARFRKLEGRFREIDVTASDARERCRNAPILDPDTLNQLLRTVSSDVLAELDQAPE
jgi:hypothetical protein